METTVAVVDRYLAAWNERDAASRRAILADTLVEDVSFCDPLLQSTGREPIDTLIAQLHGMLPGGELQRTGEVDVHHNVARFTWEAGPAGGEAIVAGTDIATFDDEGRITAISAFFDKVPAGLLG